MLLENNTKGPLFYYMLICTLFYKSKGVTNFWCPVSITPNYRGQKKKKKPKLTLLALLVQTSFVFTFVNLVGPTFSVPRVHVVNIELQEQ